MALLYGLLWRLLLALVHANRVLVSWLRVRLRTWKGRLRERVMAAFLLPLALAGIRDRQKKTYQNSTNATSSIGNHTASRRSRWLSDGRALTKLPVHIGLLVAEEEPSYTDIANLVVWCMTVGISHVSIYDNHGKHSHPNYCFYQWVDCKNLIISATSYSPVAAESLPWLLFTDKNLLSSCPILFWHETFLILQKYK